MTRAGGHVRSSFRTVGAFGTAQLDPRGNGSGGTDPGSEDPVKPDVLAAWIIFMKVVPGQEVVLAIPCQRGVILSGRFTADLDGVLQLTGGSERRRVNTRDRVVEF